MSATLEQLEKQIMALPAEERAELVGKVWESLGNTTVPYVSDKWRAELERRQNELDSGKAALVPGDQVIREARKRLGAASRK